MTDIASMKYFVTGGNGLVGSYIIRELTARGHEVVALRRKTSDMSLAADLKVEWVEGELSDTEGLRIHLQDCQAVIHAAAMVTFDPRDRAKLFCVNVTGTENMVNLCLDLGIRWFGFVSSVAALGRGAQLILDEQAKWLDSDENSAYAQSKFRAELEVWRGAAEGLEVVIVNPSIVLGKAPTVRSSLKILDYVRKGNRYYTDGLINYVDVRDVASILVSLIEQKITGQRFILNAGTLPYREFFAQVAARVGVPAPDRLLTPVMLEIGWRLAWVYAALTGKSPLITKETAKSSRGKFRYDASRIRSLGFDFRPLEETLDWCCS